ncbi:MAG: hypothetical protein K0S06_1202 [Microvirga sp.]|nr:hypothetical protein [Microvirga sp.]
MADTRVGVRSQGDCFCTEEGLKLSRVQARPGGRNPESINGSGVKLESQGESGSPIRYPRGTLHRAAAPGGADQGERAVEASKPEARRSMPALVAHHRQDPVAPIIAARRSPGPSLHGTGHADGRERNNPSQAGGSAVSQARLRLAVSTAVQPDPPSSRCWPDGPRRWTANQADHLRPTHSITSSARARRVGGIVKPSAAAVLRFTVSPNFVGCSIGRSEGFAPCRILST